MTILTPKYKINDLVIGLRTYDKRELTKRKWKITSFYYNQFLRKFMYNLEELNASTPNHCTIEERLLIVQLEGNELLKRLL